MDVDLEQRLTTEQALAILGPGIERVLRAIREGGDVTDEDLAAALTVMEDYFEEIRREVIGAARAYIPGTSQRRMRWRVIGTHLGYPPTTASVRANALGRRLGLLGPLKPRPRDAKKSA